VLSAVGFPPAALAQRRGRTRRISIVALARKLLIAPLGDIVTHGEDPGGYCHEARSEGNPGRPDNHYSRVPRGLISPVWIRAGRDRSQNSGCDMPPYRCGPALPSPDDLENEGLWCQPPLENGDRM